MRTIWACGGFAIFVVLVFPLEVRAEEPPAGLSHASVADLTDGTATVIDTGNHGIEDVIDLGFPVATVGVNEAAQRVYALEFSNGVPGDTSAWSGATPEPRRTT